jgi:hypothetical protein
MTAEAAVRRSISHDEVATLALDEGLAADERVAAALESLKALGLDGHDDADGLEVRAWGTHEGSEWTIRTIDGLSNAVTYVR